MRKLVVGLMLMLGLAACDNGPDALVEQGNGGTIEYITVDGMPCLIRSDGHSGGLTCDWTKWNGNYGDQTSVVE